ncbi:hypothetical protein ACJH6J_27915 [Mycobacterium sp. SMC-18]|uniref:hypothetical protein n=1 Tax=Mycobacterium TaxID=1763 RepID=UPI000CDD1EBD|nr:hypothetical protein [Mycobacterium kansasii]POX75443.1 hypothetical protein C3475_03045 [Mycobacterium kansasii]POY13690.1 hypothetical protein C3474_02635 [Mycobacterium kansasii]
MNYLTILDTVENSLPEHWTEVTDVVTDDGHHNVYVFHDDAAITLAWGKDHRDGQPWTEAWSQAGGFPDNKIYGHWFDIRYHGVVIHRDLLLSVDGHRGELPSGQPISEKGKGIIGMRVTEPEARRARLLDSLVHGPSSQFDRYFASANIQYR